ncbi:MAG: glycosyltransferase [Caulobacteraceae bacterium]|nr:glycosyltransferase [Caulobacteraceae bacterium]
MISVIVTTLNDERRLGATLAALTPAAIDGLVREVIVADAGSTDATLAMAEDSGARVLSGSVADAAAAARQPWLLILPAGTRLQMQWEPSVQSHIRRYPEAAGWFQLNFAADGFGARAAEALANGAARWLGRLRPQHGLLIGARSWAQTGGRGRGLRPLGARILVGGADLD